MWILQRLKENGQFADEMYTLDEKVGLYTVGRQMNENKITCQSLLASRKHCIIRVKNGSVALKDLRTPNGTFINKKPVVPNRFLELEEGDLITLGIEYFRVDRKDVYVFKLVKAKITGEVITLSDEDSESLPTTAPQPIHTEIENNLNNASTSVLPIHSESRRNFSIDQSNISQSSSRASLPTSWKPSEHWSSSLRNNHAANSRKREVSKTEFLQPPVPHKHSRIRHSRTFSCSSASSDSETESHHKFQAAVSPPRNPLMEDSDSGCARSPIHEPNNIVDYHKTKPSSSGYKQDQQLKDRLKYVLSNLLHDFTEEETSSISNNIPSNENKTSETVTRNCKSFNEVPNPSSSTSRTSSDKPETIQNGDNLEDDYDDDAVTVRLSSLSKSPYVDGGNNVTSKNEEVHIDSMEETKMADVTETDALHDTKDVERDVLAQESSNTNNVASKVSPVKDKSYSTNIEVKENSHLNIKLPSTAIKNDFACHENDDEPGTSNNQPVAGTSLKTLDSFISNSYSMDDKDDIIDISDNEEFPLSQIFDEDFPQLKSEPKIEEVFLDDTDFVIDNESDIIHDSDSDTESLWLNKLSQSDKEFESAVKIKDENQCLQKDDDNDTQDDFHPKIRRKLKPVIDDDSEVESLHSSPIHRSVQKKMMRIESESDDDDDLPVIGDIIKPNVHKESSVTSEEIDLKVPDAVWADSVGYKAAGIDSDDSEEPFITVQLNTTETNCKKNTVVSDNNFKMKTRRTVIIDPLPLPQRKASLRGISGTNAKILYEETISKSNSFAENRKSLSKNNPEKLGQLHNTENKRSSRKESKKINHLHNAENRKSLSKKEHEKLNKLDNKKSSASMSKSDMKLIRKEKLRALSSRKSEDKIQDNNSKRVRSTGRVKVTNVNRSAFLTETPTLVIPKLPVSDTEILKEIVSVKKESVRNEPSTSKQTTVHKPATSEKPQSNSSEEMSDRTRSKSRERKHNDKSCSNSNSVLSNSKIASGLAKIPKLTSGSVIQEVNHQSVLESPGKRMTRYTSSRAVISASSSKTQASSSKVATTSLSSKTMRSSLKKVNDNQNKNKTLQNNQPEKRVSFNCGNDLVSILYIPIEGKGMKMPKSRMQDQLKQSIHVRENSKNDSNIANHIAIQREELLHKILTWKPSWIEEGRNQSEPPPVNSGPLRPMYETFESLDSYIEVLQPLMRLELWARIARESENKRNQTIYVCTDSGSVHRGLKTEYYIVNCHTVLNSANEYDFQSQLQRGFLVVLELSVVGQQNDKERDHKKKSITCTFGYIMHCFKEDIKRNDLVNRDLMKNYPRASQKLRMEIRVRARPYRIDRNRIARLKVVGYIGPALKLFDGLFSLEKSPLRSNILQLNNPPVPNRQLQQLASPEVLNPSQTDAVLSVANCCLSDGPTINLIHGPPGTGKTKVIIQLILQIIDELEKFRNSQKRRKILLCAPSNAAVDEIVYRLISIRKYLPHNRKFRLARSGCLESMNPAVKSVSVQELAKKCKIGCIRNDNELHHIALEINSLQAKVNRCKLMMKTEGKTPELLQGKIYEYEKKIKQLNGICGKGYNKDKELLILQNADIIATTLGSCYTAQMQNSFNIGDPSESEFCCCIIDEATQCSEPDTLVPLMLRMRNLVLVGDPEQLRATVLSQKAKDYGYGKSLFSRLHDAYLNSESPALHFLDTQYRMHPEIVKFPNSAYYADKLITAPYMESLRKSPLKPYVVLSLECRQANDKTLRNVGEAELVLLLISAILNIITECGSSHTIGIITPYRLQKREILHKLDESYDGWPDSVVVDTIDGFQGQERDIILMSCVRTDGIGFMSDLQRINVALTRARKSLILCGNFSSLKKVPMWDKLLKDAASRNVLIEVPDSMAKNISYLKKLICHNNTI